MNILILGSGGREHAFCWKISQSELCTQLFVAPGNAGTAQYGENINISETDFDSIKKVCIAKKIDLVLVGPEEPLVKGIYDFFKNDKQLNHIIVTGPSAEGARLEGSKAFAKAFMQRHNIPTAIIKNLMLNLMKKDLPILKIISSRLFLKQMDLQVAKAFLSAIIMLKQWQNMSLLFKNPNLEMQEKSGGRRIPGWY